MNRPTRYRKLNMYLEESSTPTSLCVQSRPWSREKFRKLPRAGCSRIADPLNADERRKDTGSGSSGCQKSRLNLWLIERNFSQPDMRTNGKVGCSVDGKHRAGTVIPCPQAIGYNPIVPLVFPARCSASSSATSNLFHGCPCSRYERLATLRSRTDFQ